MCVHISEIEINCIFTCLFITGFSPSPVIAIRFPEEKKEEKEE